jgi:hypothetical protein
VLIPDGSDGRLRRLRYRGPGAVLVCCGHDRAEWTRSPLRAAARRPDVTVHPRGGGQPLARAAAVELAAGAVLETRTRPAR